MATITNIDGSAKSGSDQVLDLISLIADPVGYKKKIAELNAATEESRKLVELVAPAQDILALREKVKAELDAAVEARKKAQAASDEQIVASKKAAENIITEAHNKAAEITVAAHVAKQAAEEAAAEAEKNLSAIKSDRAALKKATTEANAARDAANAEKAAAEAEKAAAAAARNALLEKHKAFVESINPPADSPS